MTPTDWAVLAAGVASIAWVNWYFFLAERGTVVATVAADVTITVKGGYTPAVVRVKAGQPVRLIFDRQERSGCSEEIVFPDFGIKKFLPAFQTTTVEVTPPTPGTYEFTCGMSMLHGRLIAD